MAKSIKTRYKICFQTQNKVWIYKNSRLRHFYKIRNKTVLQQGKIAKKFLITKNMKWTVIRRKMVPYIRNKNRFRFQYKTLFFNKQQLKNFYGGLREYKIRNIFKKTWNIELFYRRNIFIGALEQRLNMVLFRMRLLPTIFSCTQFIMHKGIYVNDNLITLPSYRVNLGEIVSIPQDQWFIFYKFLHERIFNRYAAESILIWRKELTLKKIQYYRMKNKKFYIKNLLLLKKFSRYKKDFLILKKSINSLLNIYKKKINQQPNNLFYKKRINILNFINIFIQKTLYLNILKIESIIIQVHHWNVKTYSKDMHLIFYRLLYIKKNLKKLKLFLLEFLINNFIQKILNNLKQNPNKEFKFNSKIFSKNLLKSGASLKILLKNLKYKYFKTHKWDFILTESKKEISLRKTWYNSLKKTLRYKIATIKYKKRILFLLRKLKYRKSKNNLFKNWCPQTHWYTPNYLEIDYCTLRSIFIYYPEANEVFYGFNCNFDKIISFYKERAL